DASIIEIPNGPSLLGEQVTFSYWIYLNSEGHVDAGGNPAGNFIMGLGNFRGIQFEVPGSYAEVKVASQYGLTGDYAGQTAGGDLIFRGDGITKDNGGFIGTEVSKDLSVSGGVAALIKDKWAHIVFVYDGNANTRSLYINGELMHRDNLASLATSG